MNSRYSAETDTIKIIGDSLGMTNISLPRTVLIIMEDDMPNERTVDLKIYKFFYVMKRRDKIIAH